jgi:hypothetical protein
MKTFEIGHTYFDTWACDSDSISTIKIVGRSTQYVTFERAGKTRRAKIYTDASGEYIMPDRYSMACVYRAERELLPEPEQVEEAQPVTSYTVSADLLALGLLGAVSGRLNAKQLDFLASVVDGATLIEEGGII